MNRGSKLVHMSGGKLLQRLPIRGKCVQMLDYSLEGIRNLFRKDGSTVYNHRDYDDLPHIKEQRDKSVVCWSYIFLFFLLDILSRSNSDHHLMCGGLLFFFFFFEFSKREKHSKWAITTIYKKLSRGRLKPII